ncbi:hypothetical protein MPSEU_000309700 [Mayamaea pseudoterrestris]|nr:hypothetical protein MPSEU_000309700 [Mayamaea pseudoterrestris]
MATTMRLQGRKAPGNHRHHHHHHHRRRLPPRLLCGFFNLVLISLGLWLLHSSNNDNLRVLLMLNEIEPHTISSLNSLPSLSAFNNASSSLANKKEHYHPHRLKLRFDWTNLQSSSSFATMIRNHQNNCSLPLADFTFRNRFGMGSDLHVWTQAVCNAMEQGYRIRTKLPWIYYANEQCNNNNYMNTAAMTCYFPKSELQCPNDVPHALPLAAANDTNHGSDSLAIAAPTTHKLYRANGKIQKSCLTIMEQYNLSYGDVRAAGVEFLFRNVSPLVQMEAERQLNLVFGSATVPPHLITVHVRWGDKKDEMKLVPIERYVNAVQSILDERRQRQQHDDYGVHIFLATEDPDAVEAFTSAAPSDWNIYVDQYYKEMLPFRDAGYNGNPRMAQALSGQPGLKALASLLVAMEANDFVLTTQSNWSRLMNELRTSILEAKCKGCTRMIDLSYGEW